MADALAWFCGPITGVCACNVKVKKIIPPKRYTQSACTVACSVSVLGYLKLTVVINEEKQ